MTMPHDSAFARPASEVTKTAEARNLATVGLTKREWFAGMAIMGAACADGSTDKLAEWAVLTADALIEALNNSAL